MAIVNSQDLTVQEFLKGLKRLKKVQVEAIFLEYVNVQNH